MRLDTIHTAETPEGIALSLRPAGAMARCLAYLADFGIRLVAFIVTAIVAGAAGGIGWGVFLILYFLLEWFYPVAFELWGNGATPGKRMLGLRVVMDSGLPVTPAASLVRNLLRAADFLPAFHAFAAASMLLRPDSKRLGDLAAGTLVVYAEPTKLHGEVPPAEPLAPARPLTAREQVAIVTWASRAARLTPDRFDELAKLAQPVLAEGGGTGRPSQRLLRVAHWVLGRRRGEVS